MNETNSLTLVLGGTGKTGSRVAERLLARGRRVRIGSRGARPPFDGDDELTDDVAPVLGRPARDFYDYVRTAAATGAWDVAAVREAAR
jgi:nucleoside-diphosphate-sugar epimerase